SVIGSVKAAVLPEPVSARPIRSRPVIAAGITAAWIGVGCSKPTRRTQRRIDWLSPSDSKSFSVVSTGCCGMANVCMTLAYSRSAVRQSSAGGSAGEKEGQPGGSRAALRGCFSPLSGGLDLDARLLRHEAGHGLGQGQEAGAP